MQDTQSNNTGSSLAEFILDIFKHMKCKAKDYDIVGRLLVTGGEPGDWYFELIGKEIPLLRKSGPRASDGLMCHMALHPTFDQFGPLDLPIPFIHSLVLEN